MNPNPSQIKIESPKNIFETGPLPKEFDSVPELNFIFTGTLIDDVPNKTWDPKFLQKIAGVKSKFPDRYKSYVDDVVNMLRSPIRYKINTEVVFDYFKKLPKEKQKTGTMIETSDEEFDELMGKYNYHMFRALEQSLLPEHPGIQALVSRQRIASASVLIAVTPFEYIFHMVDTLGLTINPKTKEQFLDLKNKIDEILAKRDLEREGEINFNNAYSSSLPTEERDILVHEVSEAVVDFFNNFDVS